MQGMKSGGKNIKHKIVNTRKHKTRISKIDFTTIPMLKVLILCSMTCSLLLYHKN